MTDHLRAICANVARLTGVTTGEILGYRSTHRVARARAIAYYVAHRRWNYSLAEIGREFGRADHTSARLAIRRLERAVEARGELAAVLARALEMPVDEQARRNGHG